MAPRMPPAGAQGGIHDPTSAHRRPDARPDVRSDMRTLARGASSRVVPRRGEPDSLEGRRCVLIGGYGVGNLGDEAILAGLVQEHDLWDATVVSYDPVQTMRLHGVDAVSPFSLALPRALLRADTLVIGGGGLFSAYMGRFQRLMPLVGRWAQRLGKRVEYRAFGAYKGTPPRTARALAKAVQRADHVSVRDDSSLAYLRALGVERTIQRVADPALALDPAPPRRVDAVLAEHAPGLAGPFVALGVRRLRDPLAQARLDRALAGLCTALLREGLTPLFIPFSRHPYEPVEDDAVYARDLVAAAGGGVVLEGELHPRDVLGVVGRASCVVAVRFHALVFAVRMGRPVAALPYDAKCSDLLEEAGLDGALPADATGLDLTERVLAAARTRPRPAGLPPVVAPGDGLLGGSGEPPNEAPEDAHEVAP